MYPSQTSLIPATVALLRFINDQGLGAFSQNYPYWYFATTPFKYLIGPVVPVIEYLFHTIIPSMSLFNFITFFIIISLALGGVGWVLLLKKIVGSKVIVSKYFYLLSFTLYLLLPFKYLSAFTLEEATGTIARSMIPFVIVAVWRYVAKKDTTSLIISSLFVALILLTHTGALLALIVGLAGLCLTVSLKNGKIRHFERRVKLAIRPLVVGFLLSTIWYGPNFWLVQIVNPGIGGVMGIGAVFKALDFLKNLIPLAIALLVVFFNHKIKDRLTIFTTTWTLTFVFLTIYRLMANPYFWMDWVSWLVEVEMGLVLVLASNLQFTIRMQHFVGNFQSIFKSKSLGILLSLYLVSLLASFIVFRSLGSPKILSTALPESNNSLSLVSDLPEDSFVFVTGSNVYWLNALHNTHQVRGGRDGVAMDKDWRDLAYTFRESKDKKKLDDALKSGKVDYVLVNTTTSLDYYKDFKNLTLWQGIGENLGTKSGDNLLKVSSN